MQFKVHDCFDIDNPGAANMYDLEDIDALSEAADKLFEIEPWFTLKVILCLPVKIVGSLASVPTLQGL